MQTAQAISTRFNPDTLARLQEIAEHRNCSRSELIKEAVLEYLEHQIWFKSKVEQGLDDLDAGRITSHADMKEKIRELGYHVR
ncbi:MAG: DUF6290 family protein [Deltaproteobacteria bacterium]|nr:DUF6290 family protein [Deltaproteobacteria bacterium]